jgi:uncharacterized protein YjiS (DUF1127 family)
MSYSACKPAVMVATAVDRRERGLGIYAMIAQTVSVLLEWQERARQRRQLMALDARMLQDVGLTRADAVREAGKPFWIR